MRPPAQSQSALRDPLNYALGTETNVRIIRVLVAAEAPLGKAEVARRAGLNPSGVRRALRGLIELGIVEEIGTAGSQPVRLRPESRLSGTLRDLFHAELEQFTQLVESLRGLLASLNPPPRSAWIQGPVARGTDKPGDALVVGVLTSASSAADIREQMLSMLPEFVTDSDVQVVPRVWTAADVEAIPEMEAELDSVIVLVAPHPLQLLERDGERKDPAARRSHPQADRRALALARAIADRIEDDPDLIPLAARNLRHRRELASAREQHELDEWLELLEHRSAAQVRSVLVDPGERATRLRQSLPFLDVLTETEREEIVERVDHEA
ncbi:MAG: helix-turn-helix domain-containing protein [Gemmatimonadota bacterium]